ncbi:class I SAM-dependent methyltransferase [Motilimonas sp. E26]|uniref:class I SAM-dependent methyltransferase n=1 Tax=Motilimonas sp. E26 TaxID=2865674 RepID=UPI001E5AEFA0|nr:class I SAM-dependent methyltransferase [Motilimonas sp. E26]MCE0556219.1 class I SAM-dependent methyltransferase [Motilimonas sp. E26]
MNNAPLSQLLTEIGRINPLQTQFLDRSLSVLSAQERTTFLQYLNYCLAQDITVEHLAKSYDLIVKDTFREQVYFRRHGQYRHQSYQEVANSVYHHPEYMNQYMHGLALSTFLWPNHLAMYRFFIETLPKQRTGRYLEVGPGHGFYFMKAMQCSQYNFYQGVDISATSVEMTQRILSCPHFNCSADYLITEADFFAWDSTQTFDCLVMAEVLEHVEQPGAFLQQLYTLANEGAHVFITTCINTPAIDHIYLYPDMQSLRQQINESGFSIKNELVIPYLGKTLEETVVDKLPINTAMVLEKR